MKSLQKKEQLALAPDPCLVEYAIQMDTRGIVANAEVGGSKPDREPAPG
jgi:hypothetical protein